jgi:hypothetical protein
MKNNALIGWILILAVFGVYLYGAFHAIQISWTGKHPSSESLKIEEGLDAAISSINALLLTNFGAVLGISVAIPSSALSKNLLLSGRSGTEKEIVPPMSKREQIQFASVLVFLLVLIASMVTYIYDGWTSDTKSILPFVSQSAKMFIAVIVAYFAFILGTKPQTN